MHVSKFLPNTNSHYLRLTILVIVFVFVAVAIFQVYTAFRRIVDPGSIYLGMFNVGLGAYLICVSIYLWKLKLWAKKSAKIIIALLVIVIVAGVFNPFFAMDYYHLHDQASPNWLLLLAYIAPCVVVAGVCFCALDKFHEHFH